MDSRFCCARSIVFNETSLVVITATTEIAGVLIMVHKQQKMRSLWTLHPEVTFLNHGSFGGCPIPVLQTQSKYRDELESEPVSFFWSDTQCISTKLVMHWGVLTC